MKKYSFKWKRREKKVKEAIGKLKELEWKFKNTLLLMVSILSAYYLLKLRNFEDFLFGLKNFSYVGSFFSGVLYANSLTLAPSVSIFYLLGKKLDPFLIAAFGAAGSMLGDYLIFKFVKDNLMKELKLLSEEVFNTTNYYFQNSIFYHLFPFSNLALSKKFKIMMLKASRSKTYNLFIKLVGFFFIASPLPDELGIALLGITGQETKRFLFLSYLLNFTGIFSISYFSRI